jgi:hypothetical protein
MNKTIATLLRWDVYQWELADKANRLSPKLVSSTAEFKEQGNSGKGKWTFTNKCAYPQPKNGTGVAAGTGQKDRRLLTVAVVNCTGANGKFNAQVLRFADLFLVQPSLDRGSTTGKDQIYTEIVRVAERTAAVAARLIGSDGLTVLVELVANRHGHGGVHLRETPADEGVRAETVELELRAAGSRAYEHANDLAGMGLSADQLMHTVGLTRGEAELMAHMHRAEAA